MITAVTGLCFQTLTSLSCKQGCSISTKGIMSQTQKLRLLRVVCMSGRVIRANPVHQLSCIESMYFLADVTFCSQHARLFQASVMFDMKETRRKNGRRRKKKMEEINK